MHPLVETFLMTPICPQSLSFRSVLLPTDRTLRLQVSLRKTFTFEMSKSSRGKGDVSVDGRHICTLAQEDYVEVILQTFTRVDSEIALSDPMHQSTRARSRLDKGY